MYLCDMHSREKKQPPFFFSFPSNIPEPDEGELLVETKGTKEEALKPFCCSCVRAPDVTRTESASCEDRGTPEADSNTKLIPTLLEDGEGGGVGEGDLI